YDEDTIKELRVSSDNLQIQQLYKDFLGEPGSELAEELLHTSYAQKEKFKVFND
ncbi:MAG: iron hydrogenase small subunit, partial [Solobacterium sp.]|nr:iron hydrogenase small subunit [Solobacterium sp.]